MPNGLDYDYEGPRTQVDSWDYVVFQRNCVAIIIAEDETNGSGCSEYFRAEFLRLTADYRAQRLAYMAY